MSDTQDSNVQRASRLDTAALSDALDRLGLSGQCLGIKPRDHRFRMTGRAYTVLYAPAAVPAGTVGDFIDDLEPGAVVVIDNGGRRDATVWGDLLTLVAHTRGVAGTVIDGACRDVHQCLALDYPVYSRSYSMRTGKDRVQLEATGVAVTVGEARVVPGTLLRGDADGVVAVPREREDEVLTVAEQIEAAEGRIRDAIRAGKRLDEARRELGYHGLQSRRR